MELAEFAAGHHQALRAHVESCRRCLALVRRMPPAAAEADRPASGEVASARLPARAGSTAEAAGDVVIASTPDAPETLLVCVVIDPRPGSQPATLEVAPISTDVALASEFDVFADDADPLGYAAIVELWNHGTLAAAQISERLGPLPQPVTTQIDAVYRALLCDTRAILDDVKRGVPVETDEDPRAEFQEAEAERVRDFWKPAARLYAEPVQAAEKVTARTVGDLLSNWLERTGWDVPGYAAHIGWSAKELAVLYDDSFDPRTFQPERIGIVLGAADTSDEEFEAALRRTITVEQFAGFGGGSTSQGMAFPRATRSAKSRHVPASQKAQREPAAELERYVKRAVRAFRRASRG